MVNEGVKVMERARADGDANLSPHSREVSFASEVITPRDAEMMLRTAAHPRLDQRAVETYAGAILADAWWENGQPIIFDENGSLIDGVQRLHAVIRADKPITSLVARNVRSDTLHTIDQHRRRNYAGVLESRGYHDAGALVRTMSKLIRIENGTLNRDPLPVSWARYDRVLEANPELEAAMRIAAEHPKSALHTTPRPVLVFQALRAGKEAEVRRFLAETSPGHETSMMSAATQARMRLSGWRNDPNVRVDVDKILGNAVAYFNVFCVGDLLPDSFVWNPDLGRVRNADGRWVAAESVVRADKADGLNADDLAIATGERDASAAELEQVARKLLLRRPSKMDPDGAIGPQRVPPRLTLEEFRAFLSPGATLRARLAKEARRRLIEEASPPNLGMPVVTGYRGLREGRFDMNAGRGMDNAPLAQLRHGEREDGEGQVSARVVVVTPAMAERWLSPDINKSNRKIQKGHVKAIARDIASDHWMVNAQPICFTADPFASKGNGELRLLNGQHRLGAVIEADTPIEVPIAVNVPAAAFATFDVHAKRQVRVAHERTDARVIAAAARFQWKEDNGIGLVESSASPTASELLDTIEAHPGLAEHFARSRRAGMVRLGSAGVLTYFFYRVSREAPDLAPQFLDDLEFGEHLTQGNPVLQMRQDLISDRTRMTRKEALSRLLSTWNAYKQWKRKDGGAGAQPAAGQKGGAARDEAAQEMLDL